LLFGVLLLGATAFGVYVRYVTRRVTTLVGGPALVVTCASAFWWLMLVDAARADLSMYRLHAVFVCVYVVFGTILVADRLLNRSSTAAWNREHPRDRSALGQRERTRADVRMNRHATVECRRISFGAPGQNDLSPQE
jgi:hypothetical protein